MHNKPEPKIRWKIIVPLLLAAMILARVSESSIPVKEYGRAFYHLGLEREARGDFNGAMVDYSKALKFLPTFPQAYHHIGIIYRKKNDLNQAVSYGTKAVLYDPNDYEAYHDLGLTYREQGNDDLALASFRQAWTLYPFVPEYLYDMGLAYLQVGDEALARNAARDLRATKNDKLADQLEQRIALRGPAKELTKQAAPL